MLAPSILWFLIVSHGVTLLVTESTIADPVRRGAARIARPLGTLTRCPMCLGFWVGVALSAALYSPTSSLFGGSRMIALLLDGAASSAFCWSMRVWQHAAGADEL